MSTPSTRPSDNGAQWVLAILLLAVVNGALFYPHYLGEATFPWDFLGGYHAHAFGWISQGGLFSPPKWYPWTNMGFPAALSIQSGAWYLPIVIIKLLGLTYTVHLATIVQCLHVLMGALGVYVLLKALGFRFGLALLGAVCYELSAGFYSNQQHVDIIRAYALFPWLLWVLLPEVLNKSRWRPLIAIFTVFQFLVAAYPGNIVTAGYAGLAFVAISLKTLETTQAQRRYITQLFCIGLLGVLLSAIKWLPYVMQLSLIEVAHPKYNPFLPQHLLTLLFDYDVPFLSPNIDVTMRSLFVPAILLIAIPLAGNKTMSSRLGWVFMAMALLLGCVGSVYWQSLLSLPGLSLSRFPLSDWRPVLTLGLIILGLSGWQRVLEESLQKKRLFFLVFSLPLLLCAVVALALDVGYTINELIIPLAFVLAGAGILFLGSKGFTGLSITLLIILALANGSAYQNKQTRPWHQAWSPAIEKELYGVLLSEIKKDGDEVLSRRPERKLIVDTQGEFIKYGKSTLYNQCWYTERFCMMGNDNLKYSIPHKTLYAAMQEESDGSIRLREFVLGKQQLLIRSAGSEFDITDFKQSNAEFVSLVPNVNARVLSYGPEKVVYEIETPVALEVVENELWWPGWHVQVCPAQEGCLESAQTSRTSQYLRTWVVPKGVWQVNLIFR